MASPTVVSTSTSWSATPEPYNNQHHHRPAQANYYGYGNLIHHPTHGMVHQAHAAAAGYHYPNSGHAWHPAQAQVVTPILSYSHHDYHHHYDHYPHQQHHPQQQRSAAGQPSPPPHMIPHHALDSRGSINSLSSIGSCSYENTSSGRGAGGSRSQANSRGHNPPRRRGRGSRGGGGGNNGGYHPSSTVPPTAPSMTANGSSPTTTNNNNRGSWSCYNNNYESANTLHELQGRIVEVAQDRDGSKFIQRRLALANVNELLVAYEETLTGMEELWNDVYGNYIVQGLLQYGTEEMNVGIGRRIVEDGNVVQLSVKVYG